MIINIKQLKNIISKINLAIEKTKLNPQAGWIELESNGNRLSIKVANYDYMLEAFVDIDYTDDFHATISSETFIPLITKLECETAEFKIIRHILLVVTDTSEYTFPLIIENGKAKQLKNLKVNIDDSDTFIVNSSDLSSIADANVKGLTDSIFSRDIQQYIYVDNRGAITFTENIYINDFKNTHTNEFKILLNLTQAKLLKVFEDLDSDIYMTICGMNSDGKNIQVIFSAFNINLTYIVQNSLTTAKFPSIKLRYLADNVCETHAIIDKKFFEKALNRLMIFDKKFDITVLNYSKLVFYDTYVKLVSIKNNNYEIIKYDSFQNTKEHEAIIRFADLQKQLKAITSKTIDISYGETPAIVINGNIKQLIPEIQSIEKV